MTVEFPSPTRPAASRAAVFLSYLDYFRTRVTEQVTTLDEASRRTSRLPSGWTPLELLKHLRFVELRWIEWGFEGKTVADPWGDRRDDRWHVDETETFEALVDALDAQGEHTTAVVRSSDLQAVGAPGTRWDGQDPATLERVLFHLVQEYARHLGHLDIIVELAGGPVGE